MSMQKITTYLCCLMLTACSTTKPLDAPIVTDFPVSPVLVQYPTPPVIKKVDDTYIVTKPLVTNSVLLTDYWKRIEAWNR